MVHAGGEDRLELGQPFGGGHSGPLVLADHEPLSRVVTTWALLAHNGRLDGDNLSGESILSYREGGGPLL